MLHYILSQYQDMNIGTHDTKHRRRAQSVKKRTKQQTLFQNNYKKRLPNASIPYSFGPQKWRTKELGYAQDQTLPTTPSTVTEQSPTILSKVERKRRLEVMILRQLKKARKIQTKSLVYWYVENV